jgi:hypothetical protein
LNFVAGCIKNIWIFEWKLHPLPLSVSDESYHRNVPEH